MYRGVVQETVYWTDYLREYVNARDLERPVNLGRIWRIVHQTTKRTNRPALSKASPMELVAALSHRNGWWRDTAQRLLVERGAKSVAPELKKLAVTATDWRTALHALWTLDGLDAIEPEDVRQALKHRSPDVRAAAVRLSERWIAQPDLPLVAAVLTLADDSSWTVRRQLAATIGELPRTARTERAVAMLTRYGGEDPITVDALLSGLRGSEADVLKRVETQADTSLADAVTMLAAAVARAGDAAAVQDVIARSTDPAAPQWRRIALLQGLDTGLPGQGGGRGGRGGRGAPPSRPVNLQGEPPALMKLAEAVDDTGALAKRVLAKLNWPGKPTPAVEVTPLTPDEQQQFAAGSQIYANLCVACHQPDGRGREKLAPTLVESRYAIGDAGAATRILLAGKEGPTGLMPPLGGTLNDEQIAAVLTYVRREWGNTGSAVSEEDVAEIRGLTRNRKRPWTDAELQTGRGGRGRSGGY
jgi:mono/diheme cytochrome c family protein